MNFVCVIWEDVENPCLKCPIFKKKKKYTGQFFPSSVHAITKNEEIVFRLLEIPSYSCS